MAKYIDAEKLKEDIQANLAAISFNDDYQEGYEACGMSVLKSIDSLQQEQQEQPTRGYDEAYLNEKIAKATKSWKGVDVDKFMDEMRGREPEVDLERELEQYARNHPADDSGSYRNLIRTARHFAKWGANHLRNSTKMVDKDLEKAARKYTKKNTCYNPDPDLLRSSIKEAFIAGAKWQEKRDEETIKTAEDHAFLAGADWQKKKDDAEQAELFTIVALDAAQRAKEQMMKGAVDGEIVDSGFDDGTAILKAIVPDRRYDSGDKVKLIVIKED